MLRTLVLWTSVLAVQVFATEPPQNHLAPPTDISDTLKTADGARHGATPISVVHMRTEYLKDPLGLDVEAPRFTWEIDAGDARMVKQASYTLTVCA